MLTNIEELEKEVDLFQKNVSESNELITLLSKAISTIKEQDNKIVSQMQELEKLVSSVPSSLAKENKVEIANLLKSFEESEKRYDDALGIYVDEIKKLPNTIAADSNEQYNSFVAEIKKEYDKHSAELKATQDSLTEMRNDLNVKYNSFIKELESTNISQIYQYCELMNKNINKKFTIAYVGIAVTIALIILSFFM